MIYQVSVFERGLPLYRKPFFVDASNVRDAADQVERNLKLKPPRLVETKDGLVLRGRLVEYRCRALQEA